MKMKLMTALFTTAIAVGFAADPIAATNDLPLEVKQTLAGSKMERTWFGYMRMGLTDSRPSDAKNVLPGLGLGIRYDLPVGAIDVSASYTGTDAFSKEPSTYFYTVPRISWFYYATPAKQQSFYGGAGLAFGGVKTKVTPVSTDVTPAFADVDAAPVADAPAAAEATVATLDGLSNDKFMGLIPSVTLGYEMNRHENWRSFIQLDVSQPAFVTMKDHTFMELADAKFGPVAEFCVGFGY